MRYFTSGAGFASSCLFALAAAAVPAAAQEETGDRTINTEHYEVTVQRVVDGIEHPWGMAFLPDGRFLVTERNAGRLRIGSPHGSLSPPLAGVPEIFRYEGDTPRSQAGLFDVALHPDFENNDLVYLSLSIPSERGTGTGIVRGRLVAGNEGPGLADVETVFEMKEADQDSSGLHFGGRMLFLPDGTLLLTIGERRNISRAQDSEDQAGSIVRIQADGGVPQDNPFIGEPAVDERIFSTGHRNPQGIALHPQTGDIWINDHGPKGGDELNRVEAGNNYGWPFLTGGVDYSGAPIGVGLEREGMESPFHVFEGTVAPSGLAVYDGDEFSAWRGDLLNGGMQTQGIVRVRVQGDQVVEEERIDIERRIRDVKVAADGAIWLLTEHENGEVLRLTVTQR
ncbi:MAG: PQQ-dependent sugar dehydrogenase [Pseudomonadales bacterium]